MARIIDCKYIGRNLMKHVTIEIDARKIERAAFGLLRWRMHLARLLVRWAARILRCGVELRGFGECE